MPVPLPVSIEAENLETGQSSPFKPRFSRDQSSHPVRLSGPPARPAVLGRSCWFEKPDRRSQWVLKTDRCNADLKCRFEIHHRSASLIHRRRDMPLPPMSAFLKVFRCGPGLEGGGQALAARVDKPRKEEAARIWDQAMGKERRRLTPKAPRVHCWTSWKWLLQPFCGTFPVDFSLIAVERYFSGGHLGRWPQRISADQPKVIGVR